MASTLNSNDSLRPSLPSSDDYQSILKKFDLMQKDSVPDNSSTTPPTSDAATQPAAKLPSTDSPQVTTKPATKITDSKSQRRSADSADDGKITRHLFLPALQQTKHEKLTAMCSQNQLYSMKLNFTTPELIGVEMPKTVQSNQAPLAITMKQLLNWPGITTNIHLGHVTFMRNVIPNCKRDIVIGTDIEHKLEKSVNPTETRRIARAVGKPGPELSKMMLETFLDFLYESRNLGGLLDNRSEEIGAIFNQLKSDLKPLHRFCQKTTYSRFPSVHKFMRHYQCSKEGKSDSRIYMREVLNPEITFSIERCPFVCNTNEEIWTRNLLKYFNSIFVQKDPTAIESLKTMFKSCVTFSCLECSTVLKGVFSVYAAKQHVATHYHDKMWTCTVCKKEYTQEELSSNEWAHSC